MENVVLFKKFTRVFVVKNILSYLDLDEILDLTGVCIYFNSLIKSTFFIKYMVALKERTKVEITLDNFVQHAGDDPHNKIGKQRGLY